MSNCQATVAPLPRGQALDLDAINAELDRASAEDRVRWGLEQFGQRIVLSSSFGAQAAVSLHMVTRQRPDIPVILVDTGYLFPETYRFVDELTERLGLNLRVYRAELSPAWQEARYGKLWEQGLDGLEQYNRMNKVEPMQRALRELRADAWFAGLRRQQATTREQLDPVVEQNGRYKVHPLIDWTDRDIYRYLTAHDLPYHPLWHQGYVSIGDVHTTRRLDDGMTEEETRFFGLKRECGLHEHV
ncbi:phosphoadenylyl-sulfate reductase [Aquisalimonas lutea]|uniref:phosphoadenylyl-sulfate reductase n=1 Tax=Aquisalimonas lutea TaxID=1327750 RepID=UPI0025B4FC31|nr:phosphoadenylyl-sulfate reductase [Aquisalimonas lutea]MDN3517476.1 phosphoadenylyl-sulfate reductase [Aquisalimonas lutea]